MSDLEYVLKTAEDNLKEKKIAFDPPRVKFIDADSRIEELALKYIKTRYKDDLQEKNLDFLLKLDEDAYAQALADIAWKHQDLRVFGKGHIHFDVNLTRVATNDMVRHQSIEFRQTGQSKQIGLLYDLETSPELIRALEAIEDSELLSADKLRFYMPPEWNENAPDLLAEANSFLAFINNFSKIPLSRGMSASSVKYIFPNNPTTNLEFSGNLRSYFNIAGLRTCEGAQFENQFIANNFVKHLKNVESNLTKRLGPRCVYEPHCREGEYSCGKRKEKLEMYIGDSSSVTEKIKEMQSRISASTSELEFNDSAFLENLKIAYNEVIELQRKGVLPITEPNVRFRYMTVNVENVLESIWPDLEQMVKAGSLDSKIIDEASRIDYENALVEGAQNTYKRITGEDLPSDFKINEKSREKVLKSIVYKGHWGTFDHGNLTYDNRMSRVLLQKSARHKGLKLISSSQHHTAQSNFQYIEPPEWKIHDDLDLMYHVITRYSNNLNERALKRMSKSSARYPVTTNAAVTLRLSGYTRGWYAVGFQRTCPSNPWEERTVFSNIMDDLKYRSKNAFYYAGPPCLINLCMTPCDQKDEIKEKFLRK